MTKHIVCFGDSNTYGFNPYNFRRFDQYTRWTNVAQTRLNEIAVQQGKEKFKLTNEGLNGRTIDMSILRRSPECDKTVDFYSVCLDKRKPMDLLILMIGSNNCLSPDKPETIAEGCEWMVQRALYLDIWVNEPRILILAPPVIGGRLDIRAAADYAAGSMRRSRAIVPLYRDIAERCGQYYLDVNEAGVMTCSVDHVHLDETGHLKMSEIITDKVLEIFGILK